MSVLSMVSNALLNALFMRTMGAPGIALATVLVAIASSALVTLYVLAQIRKREASS
jgi:Na+-driven multidrug efflux pump